MSGEHISQMRVPRQGSSLYLIMQQMDLIKQRVDGSEYVVCKSSRDADADGKIHGEREIIKSLRSKVKLQQV